MDVESPEHLERLGEQPEIKAVLLRHWPAADATEARFERAAKNALYWPPIETVSTRFLRTGRVEEVRDTIEIYGRPCWLLATRLADSAQSPYAIAVAAADGAPVDVVLALLREVSHDYWHGSSFFK